jgi:hypothetical protein
MPASLRICLLAGVAFAMAAHTAVAAPNERPALKGVTGVRVSNYGAPSKLIQQRDTVNELIDELSQLRKKSWRRGDTKMRCYATVVLLDDTRPVAMFRVRRETIVERSLEKGGASYSLKLEDTDLPRLTKLLGEIPTATKCD